MATEVVKVIDPDMGSGYDYDSHTGTSGTLLGAGDFSSSRAVENGDTLNVTVTCSMTSS
jgi:hypothetical protein